jgi:hypothetical protein
MRVAELFAGPGHTGALPMLNHWLLQFDGVDASSVQQEYTFQSVLEFVDEMIENELAAQDGGTPAVQDVELVASMSDGSGTDDVEDW